MKGNGDKIGNRHDLPAVGSFEQGRPSILGMMSPFGSFRGHLADWNREETYSLCRIGSDYQGFGVDNGNGYESHKIFLER